jgi:hypothetical protein
MKTKLNMRILTTLFFGCVCGCLLAQQQLSNYPLQNNQIQKENTTEVELGQQRLEQNSKANIGKYDQSETLKVNSDNSLKEAVKTETAEISRTVAIDGLPGFPVYVNTANPELDGKVYTEAKQAWINNNQEMYNEYLKKNNQNVEGTKVVSNQSDATRANVNANGFPVYQNTGDESKDKSSYESAKKEWINNNSDKYSQLTNGSKVQLIIVTRAAFQSASAEKQQYIVANPTLYQIVD